MRIRHKHHRRHRSPSGGCLHIDDGRVTGNDECRVSFRSDDGTVIGVVDGREVLKSEMHGGFKFAVTCLAVAVLIMLGIPISIAIVKLSLLVLRP